MGKRQTPEEIRQGVRDAKAAGADGLKLMFLDRDQLEVVMSEAKALGLPTTTHIGVEETTAKDYIELGVTSIEHFYGIGDAALDGIQNFPPDMNYSNEFHRFARAGELYAQANPDKLRAIVELMASKGVAWSPTLSIYEASRDAIRAQNLPWYRDYLHPSMELYWKPNLDNHGSYFVGWGNTQEVRWRQNYRIWMDTLRHFGSKGGLITTGDDAGYIYSLYGFGLVRELELHEEAGFHPLEVIAHATSNGAQLLGLGDRLGQGARRLHRRPARRQRQPAREPAAAQPRRHRRRRQRPGRARRRRGVDDQGRHPLSRPDADGGSAADGGGGQARSQDDAVRSSIAASCLRAFVIVDAMTELKRVLGLWDIVAMNIVAVVGLRWITRSARAGESSVTLWILAWLVFFLPLAAAVIELSSRHPEQGGLYAWTRRAFGPVHGFICGWCLWVNNLFYFPSLLLFAAANLLLLFGPAAAGLTDSRCLRRDVRPGRAVGMRGPERARARGRAPAAVGGKRRDVGAGGAADRGRRGRLCHRRLGVDVFRLDAAAAHRRARRRSACGPRCASPSRASRSAGW